MTQRASSSSAENGLSKEQVSSQDETTAEPDTLKALMRMKLKIQAQNMEMRRKGQTQMQRAVAHDYDPQEDGKVIKAHHTAFNHRLLSNSVDRDTDREASASPTRKDKYAPPKRFQRHKAEYPDYYSTRKTNASPGALEVARRSRLTPVALKELKSLSPTHDSSKE